MSLCGKGLLGVGVILLFNSAHSAIQHRRYIDMVDGTNTDLPNDVVYQTLIAFAMILFAIISTAGDLIDIHDLSNMP
eukprot:Ihof_evm3s129 gene=Ihof_evmTU3s129